MKGVCNFIRLPFVLLSLLAVIEATCFGSSKDAPVFTLHSNPAHRVLANSITRWAEECRVRTFQRLKLTFRPVAIYLEPPPDAAGFRRMRGFTDRAYFDPVWLSQQGHHARNLVVHELVHCATEQFLQGRPGVLPKWFSEGIADWVAGVRPSPPKGSLAEGAARFSLADLSHEWGLPVRDLRYVWGHPLAYSLTEHLVSRYGETILYQLLTAAKIHRPFEVAFRQVTGTTLADFETDWRKTHKLPRRILGSQYHRGSDTIER